MISDKQKVITGALDGKQSDYNIVLNEDQDIKFEKTIAIKKLKKKEIKRPKTIFDFDDVDYDLERLGKKSSGKKSLKKKLQEVVNQSPCKTLG